MKCLRGVPGRACLFSCGDESLPSYLWENHCVGAGFVLNRASTCSIAQNGVLLDTFAVDFMLREGKVVAVGQNKWKYAFFCAK